MLPRRRRWVRENRQEGNEKKNLRHKSKWREHGVQDNEVRIWVEWKRETEEIEEVRRKSGCNGEELAFVQNRQLLYFNIRVSRYVRSIIYVKFILKSLISLTFICYRLFSCLLINMPSDTFIHALSHLIHIYSLTLSLGLQQSYCIHESRSG